MTVEPSIIIQYHISTDAPNFYMHGQSRYLYTKTQTVSEIAQTVGKMHTRNTNIMLDFCDTETNIVKTLLKNTRVTRGLTFLLDVARRSHNGLWPYVRAYLNCTRLMLQRRVAACRGGHKNNADITSRPDRERKKACGKTGEVTQIVWAKNQHHCCCIVSRLQCFC
jgi:hypothetical protein